MRTVLEQFGVQGARRSLRSDTTEEVLLLTAADFSRVDVNLLTLRLMEVLPHFKVWVAAEGPLWKSEQL